MNAKSRTERAALRARVRTNRAAAKIRRTGTGTLTTHALAAGLGPRAARSVAGSLRKTAVRLGVIGQAGRTHAGRRMRTCTRWTAAQVAAIAGQYRPRLPQYRAARAHFLLAI